MDEVKAIIKEELQKILATKGESIHQLTSRTIFLADLPMDSLDLATLIVNLEERIGIDPFRDGFKDFKSFGELCVLYSNAKQH
jgi:acyl carrier protein